MATFLLEIGVEELPAIPLLKILKKIEKSWGDILKEYRLDSQYSFDYTPRRLVVRAKNFPKVQTDKTIEMFGPPLKIAYRDGEPTGAALGFAKKCGVALDELSTKTKGNSEVLYYKKEQKGLCVSKVLEEMVKKWLNSMEFGKMMRWGDLNKEFIRPVRWLVAKLDDKNIDLEIFGVKSSDISNFHRFAKDTQGEVDFKNYEDTLNSNSVILNATKREEIVLNGIEKLEKEHCLDVEKDRDLLAEIIAITEYPTALLGSFDEKFLELPPEVIITSMKEHQRYFPVFKNGKLINKFVVVSNAVTDDHSKIVFGNEKVLRPRLEDALFFYHNDLKRGLKTDGLELVQFIDGLGSLKDKIQREKQIIEVLFNEHRDKLTKESSKSETELKELLIRTVDLAKADLMSEMVYEFTELQGLIGYYYAKALGEDDLVADAIKEQYMPVGDNTKPPGSIFSALVAISIKLDTLFGLFSAGKIPTGSKDPFALRRAVNGIVKTTLNYDLSFDIDKTIDVLKPLYKEFDTNTLREFIFDRINKLANVNPSVVKAVVASGESDTNKLFKKIEALNTIVEDSNSKELFATFKRVANISKDLNLKSSLDVNKELFEVEEEKRLYGTFREINTKEYDSYLEKLQALFGLKELLDSYFDNVLVNTEDEKIKINRQNTIATIYKAFRDIADIKEVTA